MKILKHITSKSGQALVEMTLVLPILLIFIFGIIQFGWIFHTNITILNASREGARYVSAGAPMDEVENIIQRSARTLNLNDLSYDIIIIDRVTGNEKPFEEKQNGDFVESKVSYNYKLTLPIIDMIVQTPKIYTQSTIMRIE